MLIAMKPVPLLRRVRMERGDWQDSHPVRLEWDIDLCTPHALERYAELNNTLDRWVRNHDGGLRRRMRHRRKPLRVDVVEMIVRSDQKIGVSHFMRSERGCIPTPNGTVVGQECINNDG